MRDPLNSTSLLPNLLAINLQKNVFHNFADGKLTAVFPEEIRINLGIQTGS